MNLPLPSRPDLWLLWPELVLATGLCAVLMVPLVLRRNAKLAAFGEQGFARLTAGHWPVAITALITCAAALIGLLFQFQPGQPMTIHHAMGRMLTIDHFSQFIKLLVILYTALVVLQWMSTNPRKMSVLDGPDFLGLILGGALGMCLMASASNLLMIWLAIEAASTPSYALAGFRKARRVSSEAALKYVVFGAASSAVMVYGISWLYGAFGTFDLLTIARSIASTGLTAPVAIGLLGLLVGIGFKLSMVPLHFWCPDVFEGASPEVASFLSVASKGAAVALLLRVVATLGSVGSDTTLQYLALVLAIAGAVSCTWGNLVAFYQTNLKRMLAYSSIAHAGYLVMALSLLLRPSAVEQAPVIRAVLFYLVVYLFMNLGAFTVAGLAAQLTGSEDMRDWSGLGWRSPLLGTLLLVFLLSLFGMPGLGGFMGKVALFIVMADARAWVLIAVLGINTVFSLYYYMRPGYFLFFREPATRSALPANPAGLVLLIVCAAALLWTGLLPAAAQNIARDFAQIRPPAAVSAAATANPIP